MGVMQNYTQLTKLLGNEDTGGDDLYQLSTVELVFWFFIYATIAVLAVGGNLLVLYIITTRPRMQSVTNYFIANLAIGDFMTGLLAIPFKFQAALFQEWFLPAFTCQSATFSETVSLSVSVFTLTCTAIDRFRKRGITTEQQSCRTSKRILRSFRAIVSPKSPKMSRQTAIGIIAIIWIVSLTQSLPFGLFHEKHLLTFGQNATTGDNNTASNITTKSTFFASTSSFNASNDSSAMFTTYQCVPIYGATLWWKVYNVYLTVITYFVPLFIVDLCYCVIGYQVWATKPAPTFSTLSTIRRRMTMRAPPPQNTLTTTTSTDYGGCASNAATTSVVVDPQTVAFQRSKRRVIKMLCIVVLVFTFCWLPYETYLVLNELRPNINEWPYINVLFFACHWLAMSNSCLNPIIYGIYNEKFQREYKLVFLRVCGRTTPETIPVDDMSSVIAPSPETAPVVSSSTRTPSQERQALLFTNTGGGDSTATASGGRSSFTGVLSPTLDLLSHRRRRQRRKLNNVPAPAVNGSQLVCMDYIASELGKD